MKRFFFYCSFFLYSCNQSNNKISYSPPSDGILLKNYGSIGNCWDSVSLAEFFSYDISDSIVFNRNTGLSYYEVDFDNLFKFSGYIREKGGIIYLADNYFKERVLINLNSGVGIHGDTIMDVDSVLSSVFCIVNKVVEECSSFVDTIFILKHNYIYNSYPLSSHEVDLVYLKLSKNFGILSTLFSGYNGYIKIDYYPQCKFEYLSYEKSQRIDECIFW